MNKGGFFLLFDLIAIVLIVAAVIVALYFIKQYSFMIAGFALIALAFVIWSKNNESKVPIFLVLCGIVLLAIQFIPQLNQTVAPLLSNG